MKGWRFLVVLAGGFALLAPSAYALWSDYAFVSSTLGINTSRLCLGDGSRGDIGCPTYAPSVNSAGLLTATGISITTNQASFTTIYASGRVGIGTAFPQAGLHLTSHLLLPGEGGIIGFNTYWDTSDGRFENTGNGYGAFIRIGLEAQNQGGDIQFGTTSKNVSGNYAPASSVLYPMVLSNAGRLGLGLGYPSRTLHVNGTALTTSWTGINFSSAANVTPTAPLEVSGTVSATRFVGDGSLLTGVTADATDRIVSGTTAVYVNSNTGYISFTSGGTTTGYYSPAGIFGAVGISTSTNQASFTTIYASRRVGIGTTTPQQQLSVAGSISATGSLFLGNSTGASSATGIPSGLSGTGRIYFPAGDSYDTAEIYTSYSGPATSMTISVGDDTFDELYLNAGGQSGGGNIIMQKDGGKVGIGVLSPTTALHVSGTLRLGNGLEACTSGRSGAVRWTGTQFQVCYGSGGWALLSSADVSGTVGSPDRIVSGTAQILARNNADISVTTNMDVSGTIKLAGTGAEVCSAATIGTTRVNPVTGRPEYCRW